jgi:hypothetical protein
LKNPKTSFVGNAAFKSYSYCIKALEPEEVFKFIADDDIITSLTVC